MISDGSSCWRGEVKTERIGPWAVTMGARSSGGDRKENQDIVICAQWPSIWAAVFDGHGAEGHLVSREAALAVAELLPTGIEKAILTTDARLWTQRYARLSGTTLCLATFGPEKVTVANVGDSICAVTFFEKDTVLAFWRSSPHRPSLPGERERLEKSGAIVFNDRVWHRAFAIGLAMSRCLGDLAAKTIGVIAKPDITELKIPEQCDRAIVTLCSDGISDVINLQDIHTQIILPLFQAESLAGRLATTIDDIDAEAETRWKSQNYIDDRSLAVILLAKNPSWAQEYQKLPSSRRKTSDSPPPPPVCISSCQVS